MKSEEDEAFDDLAKRQGDWGGGFKAKQAMAKARVEEDDDDTQVYKKPWVGLTEDEMSMIGYAVNGDEFEAMRLAEAKLRSKNT